MFDLDMTDRDQGIFDTKMMVFLWFKEEVTPMVHEKVLNEIQHCLTTLELDPVKRPWNKAQAVFLGVMWDYAKLPRDTFDIRWVDSGLRFDGCTDWKNSFTIVTTWELKKERFRNFAPHVDDVEAIQTLLLDA